MRNQNPKSYQKVMALLKAILEKSAKSIVKTSKIRAIKKEKLQAKKEAGEFVPEEEFKKAKLTIKDKKSIKDKAEQENDDSERQTGSENIQKIKADFKKSKQLLNEKLKGENLKVSQEVPADIDGIHETK
jgi:glycerol-3-phosphate O-acyltransferase